MINRVTHWDVTGSHAIKDGTTGEAFQEQCFLWEKGASVGAYFDWVHMHNNPYITQNEKA